MNYPKSLVIIPTYNEKDNISLIIPAALAQDPCLEVLIVDDGSPDGTGDIVEKMAAENAKVHLLRRPGKMGLGSAYVAGFRWALERDFERVFEMDADFSHNPEDCRDFLRRQKKRTWFSAAVTMKRNSAW